MHHVMKLISMTQGKMEVSATKYYLSGNGDTDQYVSAKTDGFFKPDKNLFDLVKKGESLCIIKGLSDELLQEIFLPFQGYGGNATDASKSICWRQFFHDCGWI